MDTPRDRTPDSLYVSLLETPLFDCEAGEILSKTSSWEGKVSCRNYLVLLNVLTLALVQYFKVDQLDAFVPQELQRQARDGVWCLTALAHAFELLRAKRNKRKLSKAALSKLSHVHAKSLKDACFLLSAFVASLTPEDYVTLVTFNRKRDIQTLVERLRQAFIDYGPEQFSQEAREYALGTILAHFGILKGSPERIKGRYITRENRSRPKGHTRSRRTTRSSS